MKVRLYPENGVFFKYPLDRLNTHSASVLQFLTNMFCFESQHSGLCQINGFYADDMKGIVGKH